MIYSFRIKLIKKMFAQKLAGNPSKKIKDFGEVSGHTN